RREQGEAAESTGTGGHAVLIVMNTVTARAGLVVLAGWLVALAGIAPVAGAPEDLSRRLAAGDVVVTDALPPGASPAARGGTAVAILRASPEPVWPRLVGPRRPPRD